MTTTVQPRVNGPTRRALKLPEAWLRATLAGIEAAILGWLLVVVPAVAVYVATAAAPVLGEADWVDAAVAGTGMWLLGHGAAVEMTRSGIVSLTPLGVSLVSAVLVYGGARRARLRRPATAAFTLGSYVAGVLGLSAIVPGTVGRPSVALGALLIGGLGLLLALWRAGARPPAWSARLHGELPDYVRAGLRGAGWSVLALVVVATSLTVIALLQGVVTILGLHETLAPGRLGTVVLVLGQLIFLPTIIVWALAWLAGPGFAVGEGTVFSPTEVVAGPLPAVPVLGALPDPGAPELGWMVLIPVLIGAGIGGWLHRRRFQEQWWQAALSGLVVGCGAALAAAVLVLGAGGGIGPGRMSSLGASPPAIAGAIAWQVTSGAVVVLLAAHPQVHAYLARGYRALRARLARRNDDGEVPDGDSPVVHGDVPS